jgi:hypothetical protein
MKKYKDSGIKEVTYDDLNQEKAIREKFETAKDRASKIDSRSVKASVYNLIDDYSFDTDGLISFSPGWCLAVYRLGKPVTYTRLYSRSSGETITGAFERSGTPLIISDECLSVSVDRSKGSHTKILNASLKGQTNYLSSNAILPGDWLLAWIHNDINTTNRIISQIQEGKPCNKFMDGLKFVGRVHSIRKTVRVDGSSNKETSYSLQGVGFDELNTQFFYDVMVATAAGMNRDSNISRFMAQLGLNWSRFINAKAVKAGKIKDNVSDLIVALIETIVGKGISGDIADKYTVLAETDLRASKKDKKTKDKELTQSQQIDKLVSKEAQDGNTAIKRAIAAAGGGVKRGRVDLNAPVAKITYSQSDRECPFAYLIPVSVAKVLGRESFEKTKSQKGVFGYSDILETLIGVQQYIPNADSSFQSMYPVIDTNKCDYNSSRKFCKEPLKGSYLPIEGSFVNKPLWGVLQQFLNPTINEMYTALKPNINGEVLPTIVARQIPFSSDTLIENTGFPLTRFLSMPRWRIDPIMVKGLDVGRSNATRFNIVHVYGDPSVYASKKMAIPARQIMLNPPIVDTVDLARSGAKAYMQMVNCALPDVTNVGLHSGSGGARVFMEAIADWTFGSHLTLNGTIQTAGIQTPIAEGDNIEFEGVAYHIESVSDSCGIGMGGAKTFSTTLQITNGMPIDQETDYKSEFPRYPGFAKTSTTKDIDLRSDAVLVDSRTNLDGDDSTITSQDPGRTVENE